MNTDTEIKFQHNNPLSEVHSKLDELAQKTVGTHYCIAAALIVVMGLVIVWYMVAAKEGFNPTQTLYMQDGDQFGGRWGGNPSRVSVWGQENMDSLSPGAPRKQHLTADPAANAPAPSAFAASGNADVQGQFTVDGHAAAGAPGSLGYQVLHSADFNCAGRKPVSTNAWDWMTNVAESMTPYKPRTDNDMSKIMNGH